eukprot:Gregarina_sp_Poly_1__3882@NODE_215_length_11293_cov_58_142259_g191_i0_p7_GENE_NODE_215_length_11293_cov_58_142259_g191_i0NODE_215_length_11293_cov_58_142259_g191_i0_p7_ORF_typecomplete_len280_score20_93C2/PF00168_30/0_0081C2/PF00168_30/58_NODE_215_length_11293_cov_58_142259_g191_i050545893
MASASSQGHLIQYSVTVDIHETKGLRMIEQDGNEFIPTQSVCISLGTQSFTTPSRANSSSSAYDTQYHFTIEATHEDLQAHLIDIAVLHSYYFSSGVIGRLAISPGAVYNRAQHYLPKSWQRLRSDFFPAKDIGWVCISVCVLAPFDRAPDVGDTTSAIMGPVEGEAFTGTRGPEMQMQHFNLLISIHRGQDLEATSLLGQSVAEPFVQVRFLLLSFQEVAFRLNTVLLALTLKSPKITGVLIGILNSLFLPCFPPWIQSFGFLCSTEKLRPLSTIIAS